MALLLPLFFLFGARPSRQLPRIIAPLTSGKDPHRTCIQQSGLLQCYCGKGDRPVGCSTHRHLLRPGSQRGNKRNHFGGSGSRKGSGKSRISVQDAFIAPTSQVVVVV